MILNVAYSSDDNYARHIGVSMVSLLRNNKIFEEINIYLIDNGISEENKTILLNLALENEGNLKFISFDDLCHDLVTDDKFSLSAYARLFLGRLTGIDKILYLDCDSVVSSSLVELWDLDISNYYVAGVQDTVNEYYKTSIGLENNFRYINSGFLLINLKLWREEQIELKFKRFISKLNGRVPLYDQGTINAVCKEKIKLLHPKFNLQPPMFGLTSEETLKLNNIDKYYSQKEIDEALSDPVFIHFTDWYFNRPWNKDSTHPMKDIYLNYLDKTPWKGQLLDNKLHRNAHIMKFIYNFFPFFVYRFISRLTSQRKILKLRKLNNRI